MKDPHLRYFWDGCNNHAIKVDVRIDKAIRHRMDGQTETSAISYWTWVRYSKDVNNVFPITRAQFRLFKKTGEKPTFPHFNKTA